MGDARALGPLLRAIELELPSLRVGLTIGRAAGRQAAGLWYPERLVLRPPWPFTATANEFIRRHGPRLQVLEYLELWPGWMRACQRRNLPVAIVDGRVTRRSLRIAPWLRTAAHGVGLFCAQTAEDAEGAVSLGVRADRVHVTGNGKHDVLGTPPRPDPGLVQAVGAVDLVVGSLNPREEASALSALAAFPGRVLLVPRYVERAPHLHRRARALGVSCGLRSVGGAGARWVILDSVGELAAAWGLGRVALVGGTFCRREGQNLIEPALHGLPIVHGPRIANVAAEARALAGRGATCVADFEAAVRVVRAHLDALQKGPATLPDSRIALHDLRGAVGRQMALLRPFLEAAAVR